MSAPYFERSRPRVFGHRGAGGVAPENTTPSFALALELGAEYLELDVHGTRDGAIVVIHDPDVDRTTDETGPVREYTLAQLERLDAGYRFSTDGHHFPYRAQGIRIPTLAAVLKRFPGVPLNIEIKQEAPSIVVEVVRLLTDIGQAANCLLAAEQDTIMAEIRHAAGERIATSFSAAEVVDFLGRLSAGFGDYRPAGRALQIPPRFNDIDLITAQTVAAAHQHGLEVHAWTINDSSEIARLLALQVDGIFSDLPGLVRAAVAGGQGRA